MRTRAGVLTAALVASVLSFGSPASGQDESTTTTDETTTTVEETTTTVEETTTTVEETTTTVEETTTTVEETTTTVEETTTTTEPCSTTTTTTVVGDTTTTVAAPETTEPCTDDTTTTVAESDPANEPEPSTTEPETTTTEPDAVRPATPGAGTPGRGTQVQTRPLPPKPTTTTTTTTTTLPPVPPAWQLPANSGSGRRVVYSKSAQRVWVVNSAGQVIKKHLVSGRQTPLDPRPGTYSVWSRSRYTHSINNPSIRWGYMVRFAWGARGGNIGFHEIPYQYGRPVQTVAQLGQPLSGGCVRQSKPDAIWMWNWAQLGTKVVVLG